jgi:outer membrane protein OmpA-like peptidoglycan-associated protein
MMVNFRTIILTLILMSSYSVTYAEDMTIQIPTSSAKIQDMTTADPYHPAGYWYFLGGGMGLTNFSKNGGDTGYPLTLKALASYYTQSQAWAFDVGLGGLSQSLEEERNGHDNTASMYLEVAARHRLTQGWQIGPVYNLLTGDADIYGSSNNVTSFIGALVGREFVLENKNLIRVGGRLMTDIGIGSETITTGLLEVQVGGGARPTRIAENRSMAPHLADQALQPAESRLNYEFDSAAIGASGEVLIDKIAKVLKTNPDIAERIEIIGHADEVGTEQYNERLSARRAKAVAQQLERHGLSTNKLTVGWLGERAPLDKTDFARNRSVEIRLINVKDKAAIERLLK